MRYILASKSPRRKELLSLLLPSFEIITSDADEYSEKTEPENRVVELALTKARAVYDLTDGDDRVVIGADTLCYMDGVYIGKPRGIEDAKRMLSWLSGKTHSVYTGVAILHNGREYCFCDRSDVTFKELTDADIDRYIAEFKPLDKAGAYGIQDGFVVASYTGSFNNIVGLPTEKLAEKLSKSGLLEG